MAALFIKIEAAHGVTDAQVRDALTQRPWIWDFSVIGSFALLYGLLAHFAARRIWRRFPPQEESMAGFVATVLASFVSSAAGVFAGEIWSGLAEGIRVGNGHLSYRLSRIPWAHHRSALFVGGALLFWFIAAFQYRRSRSRVTSRPRPHPSAVAPRV